jgi:hypothetical protein
MAPKHCRGPAAIFSRIAAINLPKHLSFVENRIPRKLIGFYLPELEVLDKFTSKSEFDAIQCQMEAHNRTVKRGIRMRLVPEYAATGLLCTCPGNYAIHFDVSRVVSVLKACSAFGERVMAAIMHNRDARLWPLCDQIVILRHDWHQISRRMMQVAVLIRASIVTTKHDGEPQIMEQLARMMKIFGLSSARSSWATIQPRT